MKKINIFMISLFIISLFLIAGCGSKTAGISVEGVNVEVTDYAKVPTDIATQKLTVTTASMMAGTEQATKTTEKPYRVVKLIISGSPQDHFYGSDAIGLLEIYDEDGSQCSSLVPIKGTADDVLVKGKVELVGLTTCKNPAAAKSQFIFRQSTTQGLDSVGDKFFVDLANEPAQDTLATIKEWSAKKKVAQEQSAKAQEEQNKVLDDKLAKVDATKAEYNARLTKCIQNKESVSKCIGSSTEQSVSDFCNRASSIERDCKEQVKTTLCALADYKDYCSYI